MEICFALGYEKSFSPAHFHGRYAIRTQTVTDHSDADPSSKTSRQGMLSQPKESHHLGNAQLLSSGTHLVTTCNRLLGITSKKSSASSWLALRLCSTILHISSPLNRQVEALEIERSHPFNLKQILTAFRQSLLMNNQATLRS